MAYAKADIRCLYTPVFLCSYNSALIIGNDLWKIRQVSKVLDSFDFTVFIYWNGGKAGV